MQTLGRDDAPAASRLSGRDRRGRLEGQRPSPSRARPPTHRDPPGLGASSPPRGPPARPRSFKPSTGGAGALALEGEGQQEVRAAGKAVRAAEAMGEDTAGELARGSRSMCAGRTGGHGGRSRQRGEGALTDRAGKPGSTVAATSWPAHGSRPHACPRLSSPPPAELPPVEPPPAEPLTLAPPPSRRNGLTNSGPAPASSPGPSL